jgi:hypothetical protein
MKKVILLVCLFVTMALAHFKAQAQTDTTFSVFTSANPFEDQITINIILASKNVTGLKILDAIGKEVSNDITIHSINRGNVLSYTLDFTNARPGVYFCSIYSDKGILETRKLFRSAR